MDRMDNHDSGAQRNQIEAPEGEDIWWFKSDWLQGVTQNALLAEVLGMGKLISSN